MPTAGGLYFFTSKNSDPNDPALILIHGAGGTHLHWPYNLRRLNHHHIFSPDLPGHGKSNGLGEQSVEKYAQSIAAWMREAGIRQATVAGHSMGGAIAQTLALNHPKLVEKLILISTGPRLSVNPDMLEKLSSPSTSEAAIDLITKWSYAPGTDPKLLEHVSSEMKATRPAVLYGDFIACDQFDSSGHLAELSMPVLVICGEVDKMTPPSLSKQLASQIPRAKLVVIPGAGHMVMLEQPEAVAKAILPFIRKKALRDTARQPKPA